MTHAMTTTWSERRFEKKEICGFPKTESTCSLTKIQTNQRLPQIHLQSSDPSPPNNPCSALYHIRQTPVQRLYLQPLVKLRSRALGRMLK